MILPGMEFPERIISSFAKRLLRLEDREDFTQHCYLMLLQKDRLVSQIWIDWLRQNGPRTRDGLRNVDYFIISDPAMCNRLTTQSNLRRAWFEMEFEKQLDRQEFDYFWRRYINGERNISVSFWREMAMRKKILAVQLGFEPRT